MLNDVPTASSLMRTRLCPGWFRRWLNAKIDGLPEDSSSDADRGSLMHRYCAEMLRSCSSAVELEPEDRDTCDSALIILTNLTNELFDWATVEKRVEERLYLRQPGTILPEFSGQPDVVIISEAGVAFVPDYKMLWGSHPDASQNLQALGYAALVAANYPHVHTVHVAIIQPRVTHTPEVATYDAAMLTQAVAQVRLDVQAAQAESAPIVPGPSQCQWCPVREQCGERLDWIAHGGSLDIVPRWRDGVAQTRPLLARFDALTPAQRGALIPVLQYIQTACGRLLDKTKRDLEKIPGFVEGWEVKEGRRDREITDRSAAMKALLASECAGITKKDLWECTRFSITDLEKRFVTAYLKKMEADGVRKPLAKHGKAEFNRILRDAEALAYSDPRKELSPIPITQ